MKTDEVLILALAGVAVWLIVKGGALPGFAPAKLAGGGVDDRIRNDALPGQPGYGWSYYDGGIAISPQGVYYSGGVPVWSPT